jgi:hypothetical protein
MSTPSNVPVQPLRDEPVMQRMAQEHFRVGIEDMVILPLVTLALVVLKLLKGMIRLLIRLLDFLFPILLQLMRFPLFTLRILGDGIAALTKAVVAILPVGSAKRAAWRDAVSAHWTWLRRKFSYHAFEAWVHHAFESGMAWVFRRCRTLTPNQALLVIFGAILWLPISFGAATLLHAVLLAKATTLPAWMQLLHPFATIIAKSKLLVLPVYPAAWPQARNHPLLQSVFEYWSDITRLYLARKTVERYRQADGVWNAIVDAGERGASRVGLTQLVELLLNGINGTALVMWWGIQLMLLGALRVLAVIPLFGAVVQRYTEHYDEATRQPAEPLSEKVSDFYARWSVKFTAQYYEDREREEAAKGHAGA